MAAVPQILKIITFSLAATDFSDDVLDVELVPTPGDIQTVTTLDGVTHQDVGATARHPHPHGRGLGYRPSRSGLLPVE